MRYRTLLLDLDHTIFDFDASELAAFEAAVGLLGVDHGTTAQHLATYQALNNALWSAAERGEITSSDIRNLRFERLAAELGLTTDSERVRAVADSFVAGLGSHGDLFPGALEVLQTLATRVEMAIVSNGLGEVVHARIDRLGIGPLFRAVIVSSEVGASKPDPRIFDAAFTALGSPDPSTTLMVGDSLTSDIAGGRAYGIDTCWYNPDARSLGDHLPPTYEIRSLQELLQLVPHAIR